MTLHTKIRDKAILESFIHGGFFTHMIRVHLAVYNETA